MSTGDYVRGADLLSRNIAQVFDQVSFTWGGVSTGAADVQVLSPTIPMDRLVDGDTFHFTAGYTNATTTPTLNVGKTGAKTVVKVDGTALAAGDITAGTDYIATYHSSSDKWVLLGSLTGDLAGLEALSGTGIAVRTGASTWTTRTITGTADVLSVTNGSGVSGNPTLDLDAVYRSGWINPNESWSYASATTITVPTDATTKYQVGDRIKLTQSSTVKYFYIIGVAATTLTITGGSDYTLANSAITANYYSKVTNPLGFPAAFNYSPTFAGFSANPTSVVARFSLVGRWCHVTHREGATGTSNATNFTVSMPITAATISGETWGCLLWGFVNGGVGNATPGLGQLSSSSSTLNLYTDLNATAWSNVSTKRADFDIWYEI